jgi:hypothetical protein
LVNTVVADNRTTLAGAGVFISSDSSGTFYHTTVARNTGSDGVGVRVEGAAFLTNTIVASHTVGVHSSGNTILNATLWHGNGTDWAGDGTVNHANDVWGDPTFVDPGAGDYHITPHSAAVDQGVHTAIATDIDGQTRPMGLAPDLGADEIANSPSIRYVATSGSDTTMCTHPFSPCRTVQYAVDVAESGDEVLVAQGIYTGVNDYGGLSQVVYLTKSLTLRGGYTTTDWSASHPVSYPTTLDAQGQGRVIYVAGEISPTIEGFRITGGKAVELGDGDNGAGIYLLQSAATVSHNEIYSNTSGGAGGGIMLDASDTLVTNNRIFLNTAAEGGAGIALGDSNAVVRENAVFSNTLPGEEFVAEGGAGLMVFRGAPIIEGNVFAQNRNEDIAGGGIYLFESPAILRQNLITANHSYLGGGVYARQSAPQLESNTIAGNTAEFGAGGCFVRGGASTLIGDMIVKNEAGSCAGVLFVEIDAQITNAVIANNRAITMGSGLCVGEYSSVHIAHATIAQNGDASEGDSTGIWVSDLYPAEEYQSSVFLTNTILVSQTIGITVAGSSTATLQGTLWGNETDWAGAGTIVTGTVNVSGNPDFVDPDGGNYHISVHSAAVDAGVDAGVVTDIDGEERPMGFGPDIGADEVWRRIYSFYLPILHR